VPCVLSKESVEHRSTLKHTTETSLTKRLFIVSNVDVTTALKKQSKVCLALVVLSDLFRAHLQSVWLMSAVGFRLYHFSVKLIYIRFKNSVPTSQKTPSMHRLIIR
jgi:hypothetical protein